MHHDVSMMDISWQLQLMAVSPWQPHGNPGLRKSQCHSILRQGPKRYRRHSQRWHRLPRAHHLFSQWFCMILPVVFPSSKFKPSKLCSELRYPAYLQTLSCLALTPFAAKCRKFKAHSELWISTSPFWGARRWQRRHLRRSWGQSHAQRKADERLHSHQRLSKIIKEYQSSLSHLSSSFTIDAIWINLMQMPRASELTEAGAGLPWKLLRSRSPPRMVRTCKIRIQSEHASEHGFWLFDHTNTTF